MEEQSPEQKMAELYAQYAAQRVLDRIASGRRLVPGHGMLPAPVMIVGEAPGEEEDRRGRPFTGPAGTLLRALLAEAAIPWEYCYVANVLPWRPPANRTPYPFEVQASEGRLSAEVTLADPEVVIAAGAVAWKCLTRGSTGPFEEARLKWHNLDGRRLVVIPHPSFILRLPPEEQPRWRQETVGVLSLALGQPA